MKKSTLITVVALLAAVAGALITAAVFLDRRAKKLDEYEALLFSEEFNDEFDDEANEELASLEPDAPVCDATQETAEVAED